jgi:hypothetical protein
MLSVTCLFFFFFFVLFMLFHFLLSTSVILLDFSLFILNCSTSLNPSLHPFINSTFPTITSITHSSQRILLLQSFPFLSSFAHLSLLSSLAFSLNTSSSFFLSGEIRININHFTHLLSSSALPFLSFYSFLFLLSLYFTSFLASTCWYLFYSFSFFSVLFFFSVLVSLV